MSNHSGAGPSISKPQVSDEMKGLLEQQIQIKKWLQEVHTKIYTLEEAYLEETPLGNVIRGWEIDGKPLPLKFKGQEEKERLFSCSSYQYLPDKKVVSSTPDTAPEAVGEKRSHHASSGSNSKSSDGLKSKKVRKSSSKKGTDQHDEWENHGDY